MDEKSKREFIDYYSGLIKKHGDSVKSVVYQTAEQQNKRFCLLSAVEPIHRQSSILDVGCGLGHFCEFLRKYGWQGAYTGLDINPAAIATAKKRLPNDNFILKDILTEEFNGLYDYVFCGATLQHRPRYSDPNRYLEEMVKKMFSLARRALVFDIFSSRSVDYIDELNLYVDPANFLNFCYSLTSRISLRNDSRPFEIMVYLYKQESRDASGFYSQWIGTEPVII